MWGVEIESIEVICDRLLMTRHDVCHVTVQNEFLFLNNFQKVSGLKSKGPFNQIYGKQNPKGFRLPARKLFFLNFFRGNCCINMIANTN